MSERLGLLSCDGFRAGSPTPRPLLHFGGLSVLGMPLPALLRAAERSPTSRPRARSVIFLHQWGGPSHHDSLDMKPTAPEEVRGQYKPTACRVPDLLVCERLPRMA